MGGVCLRYIKPNVFLMLTVLVSIIGNVLLFLPYNAVTTWLSFILIGVGFANIFPLIFSICVDRIPEKTNEISGLMTTAIVGAAIVPLLTGFAANFNPRYAFFVTLACLLYLTVVALRTQKTEN
jgi:fucose permease